MNSGDIQEPANDCQPIPWLAHSAPEPARRPILVLQINRPLERDLLLRWELLTLSESCRLESGDCAIPAGGDGALLHLPLGDDELESGEELTLCIRSAGLRGAQGPASLEPLEIWRMFSNFSLWSETGAKVSFRAPTGGPASENGFFVTLDGRRVAVDFEQVVDVNLKRPGAGDEVFARLTLAPSLGS